MTDLSPILATSTVFEILHHLLIPYLRGSVGTSGARRCAMVSVVDRLCIYLTASHRKADDLVYSLPAPDYLGNVETDHSNHMMNSCRSRRVGVDVVY